jgi:hypothetical protein
MRVKVKNILWDKRHLYAAGVIQEFYEYVGTQVPAPKGAAPGTICLTTGQVEFPIRRIDPACIVSIDDTDTVLSAVSQLTKVVDIAGSKGNTYQVTITPTGRSCTCSGYEFRKNCKHISIAV